MWTRAQQTVSVLTLKPFDIRTAEGRSRERYRRVAISSASLLLAKLVATATLLISIPLTLDYLGRERFGLWAALSTLLGFLALADLGVGNALVNATARAMGKENRLMAQKAVSSAFYVLSAQGLLLIVIFGLLQSVVDWPSLFNVHSETATVEITSAIAVVIGITALQLPLATVQRVQEGFQEGYVNHLWQAAASCAGLASLLVVVHFKLGLPWLVGSVAGAPVLALIMNSTVQYWSARPWLRPNRRFVDRTVSGDLVRTGSLFFVLTALTFAGIYSDNLIISRMLGASAVAEYAVVQKLSLVAYLFWAFIIPLWPAYAEATSRGDREWMRRTFERTLAMSIAMGLVVGVVFALFGRHIIRWWVGAEMQPDSALLYGFACFIFLAGVIGSISVVTNSGPLLAKQLWLLAPAAVVSVWLKVILISRYGVSGVIWATVIAFGLFYVLPGVWMIRRFVSSH